jgi:hypothetical protein
MLYQTLCSLYSTAPIIPYTPHCTVHLFSPVCCTKHCALCKVPHSYHTIYAVWYCSLSQTCLLYQNLCSLYITSPILPYIVYCAFHSVTPLCRTKHPALCTVPLSPSPIYYVIHFIPSQHFAVPKHCVLCTVPL